MEIGQSVQEGDDVVVMSVKITPDEDDIDLECIASNKYGNTTSLAYVEVSGKKHHICIINIIGTPHFLDFTFDNKNVFFHAFRCFLW